MAWLLQTFSCFCTFSLLFTCLLYYLISETCCMMKGIIEIYIKLSSVVLFSFRRVYMAYLGLLHFSRCASQILFSQLFLHSQHLFHCVYFEYLFCLNLEFTYCCIRYFWLFDFLFSWFIWFVCWILSQILFFDHIW